MLLNLGKALLLVFLPTVSLAEVQSNSGSNSSSNVFIEGSSSSNTPSVGGSSNSTSSCVIGSNVGLGIAGFGFSLGSGATDEECNIRKEAEVLYTLLGKSVAIAHLCKFDETIRKTLVEQGHCIYLTRD
jgi:hypothetical protein